MTELKQDTRLIWKKYRAIKVQEKAWLITELSRIRTLIKIIDEEEQENGNKPNR